MKTQKGAALVEFALIALLFFMMLFAIIEFARAFFVYNTLVEATRRGARIAAVCPVSTDGIRQVRESTIFDTPEDGQNTPILGLTTADVEVSYYDDSMVELASESSPITYIDSNDYNDVRFVEVSISSNTVHPLFIPGIAASFTLPAVRTLLPSESLGRVTSENPITQRCCYGICSTDTEA